MPKFSEIKPETDDSVQPRTSSRNKTKRSAPELKAKSKRIAAAISDLPSCIRGVYQAVDEHGYERGSIVIEAVDSRDRGFFAQISMANLAQGRTDDLAQMVVKANLHAYLSMKGLRELGSALMQSISKPIYLVQREGLHTIKVGSKEYQFYVHRGIVFPLGELPAIKVGVVSDSASLPAASCNLNDWQKHIGKHLRGNPYLLIAVLAAISAAVVRAFNLPRLLLALIGQSSVGKTTIQQVAQSLHKQGKDIQNCSGTANGLRSYLEQFPDQPAFLDEMHMVEDAEGLVKLIFLNGNGASRKTSTSDQKTNTAEALTCVLIAASEKTLDEIVASTRITLTEGISARYIEVVVGGEMGAFHTIPDGMTPKQFSDSLKVACEAYYGAFWDALIADISKNYDKLAAWLPDKLTEVEAQLCEGMGITDRVTLRMVRGLAVWACAGLLAVNLKLLKLKPEEIVAAIQLVLKEHLERQKHGTTPVGEKVINHVRNLIDRNSSRFPALSMFDRAEQTGIYGYTKGVGEERLFLMLPGVFEEQIGAQFGTQMAVQKLLDAGYLSVDSEGAQRQFRLPSNGSAQGQRKRFYAIKASIRYESEGVEK